MYMCCEYIVLYVCMHYMYLCRVYTYMCVLWVYVCVMYVCFCFMRVCICMSVLCILCCMYVLYRHLCTCICVCVVNVLCVVCVWCMCLYVDTMAYKGDCYRGPLKVCSPSLEVDKHYFLEHRNLGEARLTTKHGGCRSLVLCAP